MTNGIKLRCRSSSELIELMARILDIAMVISSRGELMRYDCSWNFNGDREDICPGSNDYRAFFTEISETETIIRFWYRYDDDDNRFVKMLNSVMVNRFPLQVTLT